jgi:putative transposase
MVKHPADYPWSSYRRNAHGEIDGIVVDHPVLEGLGRDRMERAAAYRELVEDGLSQAELEAIRLHVNKGCALGSVEFQHKVAETLGRRAHVVRRGRPRKNK